jgi:phage terminase large subunit-like protein
MPDDLLEILEEREAAAIAARDRWLTEAWAGSRRGKQIPPKGDYSILYFLAGRGFGKTRAIVEAVWWDCWRWPDSIGHFVAPTGPDLKATGFEGPAGFRACVPAECLRGASWEKAYRSSAGIHVLYLANGSIIRGFSATDEGARLRGPQCHVLGGDELREWDKPAGSLKKALANALLGLRLSYPDGSAGRAYLGTTPKPIAALKELQKREGVRVVRGTSYENIRNLSKTFRDTLLTMAGTQLGRQELDAIFVDEESDQTIIKRNWVRLYPADRPLPAFSFVIECYDTAASEKEWDPREQERDPSGCAVFGVFDLKSTFTQQELLRYQCRGRYAALLLDCWTEHLGLPDLLDRARKQNITRYGPHPGRRSDVVLIENASSGPGMRQFMKLWNVPTWPYNTGGRPKIARINAVSPIIKQGGLWVVESKLPDRKGLPRNWVEPYLEQLCGFAGEGSVEHDEYVDVTSSGFEYLHQRGMLDAKPDETHIDLEAKLDADRREAEETRRKMQREETGNPYS